MDARYHRSLSPWRLFLFLGASAFIAHAESVLNPASPSVTISAGVVVGTSTASKVNAFLGVPYADPPERFAPPKPAKAWSSPLTAQTLPPSCIQQFSGPDELAARTRAYFNNPYNDPPEESEDCLYLNVYTPVDSSSKDPKAVLFWLYGGNLQFGTGSLAYYDGTSLAANQDVVVVTINYRTNMFGFSNSPEIPFGSQNSGFLDQRLALSWVQENIAAFGGDPDRVTIFGESAGAYSVRQLLAHPPSPMPYSAAILQSFGLRLLGNSSNNYGRVASHFNCTSASSTLACLREVSATSIKRYIEAYEIDFAPVDKDGTHTKDLSTIISGRQLAQVPIMLGSNANEGSVFVNILGLDDGTRITNALISRLGPRFSAFVPSIVTTNIARALDGLRVYGDRLLTNGLFTCPLSAFVEQAAANGYSVWHYYYSAAFPSVELFPNSGAYHSAEIPLVFGTYAESHGHENAPELQRELSKHMQRIWGSFAKQEEFESSMSFPSLGFEMTRVGRDGADGLQTTSRRSSDLTCKLSKILISPLLW